MSTILSFLSNIKLSITQILAIAAASVIGFLVVALKVEGSELHALKVQMLEKNLDAALVKPQANVDAARKAFNDELFKYTNAGGEL